MSEHTEPHPVREKNNDQPGYRRQETESERLDRNWNEILQELRVTQTGTQILTGFLLTVAFQSRFTDLDQFQIDVYLILVVIAALTTVLGLTPVVLHRRLFRQRAKDTIVMIANRFLQATLVGVAIVLTGTLILIFDVVIGREAGLVVGALALVAIVALWLLTPGRAHRRERRAG
jgi:hypothetical protein